MSKELLAERKNDHLDIVLDPQRACSRVASGFAALTFEHCAMPELRLDDIDLQVALFGKTLNAPLLISSMTGGAARATQITILIAHRLSTVMHADTIYVLEKGQVVESGSHAALLEVRGLYYAMWRQQIGERPVPPGGD